MIKRYEILGGRPNREFPDYRMEEDTSGDWVRFSGHESEIASLKQKLKTAWDDALEQARCAYAAHNHVNNGDGTDTCRLCGLDLRDPVHLRFEETKMQRLNALKSKEPV